jgi:hypothetical protein
MDRFWPARSRRLTGLTHQLERLAIEKKPKNVERHVLVQYDESGQGLLSFVQYCATSPFGQSADSRRRPALLSTRPASRVWALVSIAATILPHVGRGGPRWVAGRV